MADRTYALNITATVKDYERKLGEVPGITAKEARKAALALHNELVKGQRAATAAARQAAQEAAESWGRFGTGAEGKAAALADANSRISDSERAMLAAMRDAEVAAKAKAQALGITTTELRALEAAQERERAAAAAAAAETEAATKAAERAAAAAALLTDEERAAAKALTDGEAATRAKADALGITVGQLKVMEAQLARTRAEEQAAADAAAEAAQKQEAAADAARAASHDMERAGDAAGKAGEGFGKLAGAADLIPGPLGDALRTMADLADVAEVGSQASSALGLSMGRIAAVAGPVALAVAAVAGAYAYSAAQAEKLTARADASAEALRRVRDASADPRAFSKDLIDEYRVSVGLASQSVVDLERANAQITETYQPLVAAQTAAAAALRRQRKELEAQRPSISTGVEENKRWKATVSEVEKQLADLETQQKATRAQIDQDRAAVEGGIVARNKQALANERAAEAEEAAAAAAEKRSRAEAEFARQVEELRAALEARQADRELEANFIQLSAESEMRAIFEKMDAEKAAAEESERLDEEERKRIEELTRARRESAQMQVSAYGDMFGSIADIASTISDSMAEKDKRAALAAFRVSQAAAIAQAGINTALAISNALAQPVPPPVAAALAVAAGIAGGAQVAAIAAQEPPAVNDTPGPMRMSQRTSVSVGSGDYVVAARDPREVQRQAASLTGSRGDARDPFDRAGSYTVIGARAYGRFVRDDVAARSPLSQIIQGERSGRSHMRPL